MYYEMYTKYICYAIYIKYHNILVICAVPIILAKINLH